MSGIRNLFELRGILHQAGGADISPVDTSKRGKSTATSRRPSAGQQVHPPSSPDIPAPGTASVAPGFRKAREATKKQILSLIRRKRS